MRDEIIAYFDQLGQRIGGEFFLVGGCVRDDLRGQPVNDYDLVVRNVLAQNILSVLQQHGRAEEIGDHFKVFAFFPHELEGRYEVALPRTESTTGIGHKGFTPIPDPTLHIEDDLRRRDFTVNAMARNVHTGELHDPLNCRRWHLTNGILFPANPEVFGDDPLRILRGIRFVAQHGFSLDPHTASLMTRYAHRLGDLPGERIRDELVKIVQGPNAPEAFELAQDLGVLPHFLPELSRADGCAQNKWHSFDVFTHILEVLRHTVSDDWNVLLGALFHDIGKPPTKWIDLEVDPTGNPHFYQNAEVPGSRDHDEVGAKMTREIMDRLRFSKEETQRVSGFVDLHMFSQDIRNGRPAARRLLKRIKDRIPGDLRENVTGLFAIRYGDCRGGKVYAEGSIEATELAEAIRINERFEALVVQEIDNEVALTVKDLAVNGHDLMRIGLKGIAIGEVQRGLLEIVLEDPEQNEREALLNHAYDLAY